MKAKNRHTNEVVEIISFNGTTARCREFDRVSYIDSKGIEHSNEKYNYYWDFIPIKDEEVENIQFFDWEQRRYELAKEYSKEFVRLQHYKGMSETGVVSSKVSEWSVELADSLIEELKKEKQHGN